MKDNLTPDRKMCPKCQYTGDDFIQMVQTTMDSSVKGEVCPECNGSKVQVYSCCTGEPVYNESMICPVCKEHLGEEPCQTCEGEGVILESQSGEAAAKEAEPQYDMYRAVTKSFRELMIKELAANYDKGDRDGENGWIQAMDNKDYLSEIYYHTGKLQAALKEGNIELIKEYAADIANGALMCLDKHHALAPYPYDKSMEDWYFNEHYANINNAQSDQGQEEAAWRELFKELTGICLSAPFTEPDRENYIMQNLKQNYHLIKKP